MSTVTEEIAAACAACDGAWKRNDAAAVSSFYTEDGTLINPFGERADGRAAVQALYAQYFGSLLRGTSSAIQVETVRTIEPDHAFVDSRQTISGADGTIVLVVHLSALMRRDAGTWRFADARPYTIAAVPS